MTISRVVSTDQRTEAMMLAPHSWRGDLVGNSIVRRVTSLRARLRCSVAVDVPDEDKCGGGADEEHSAADRYG